MEPPTRTYSEQEWRELPTQALIKEGVRWTEQAAIHAHDRRHAFAHFCQHTEPMDTLESDLYRRNYDDLMHARREEEIATEQMLWYVVERDRRLSQMPLAELLHTWEHGTRFGAVQVYNVYQAFAEARLRPIFQETAWPSESIDALERMAHDMDTWLAFAAIERDDANAFRIFPRMRNENIRDVQQRLQQYIDERLEQRQQQSLAAAGGLHPRLGAASGLRVFDDELLRHIGGFL